MTRRSLISLLVTSALTTACPGGALAPDPDAGTDGGADGDADTDADGDGDGDGDADVDSDAEAPLDADLDADGDGEPPLDEAVTAFLEDVPRGYLDSFADSETPIIWSEAAVLEALLVMHEATGDRRLLDEMEVHLDQLLATTSEARGIVDEVRGEPVPAWGTGSYSCGRYHAHAVHTGVLVYPMGGYARQVYSDATLPTRYAERASAYVAAATAALALHAAQYRASGDEASYRYPADIGALATCDGTVYADLAGDPMPFNMMLSMGRAHVTLGQALELSGESAAGRDHLDRAAALAVYFASQLERDAATDTYGWLYLLGGRPEDAAHGSLDVRFAALAHSAGLGFTAGQMDRLARTFVEFLAADPDEVRSHLDHDGYGGGYDSRWQRGAVRWAPLAAFDRQVYDVARYIYWNAEGASFVGRALLHRHRPDDDVYPIHADPHAGLPVDEARLSLQPSGSTGLYRPSDTATAEVAGATVSSCVRWTFEAPRTEPVTLRYRHTATSIAGDSCSGDACGTAPGLLVFESEDLASWTRVSGVPEPLAEEWRTETVTLSGGSYQHLLACRSGAGHARDNLQIRYARVE